MTTKTVIRIPALLCIQIQVAFVNPIYTTYCPLGIPEGMKKYINNPVHAMIKNSSLPTYVFTSFSIFVQR